jgi:hypothetical protein
MGRGTMMSKSKVKLKDGVYWGLITLLARFHKGFMHFQHAQTDLKQTPILRSSAPRGVTEG